MDLRNIADVRGLRRTHGSWVAAPRSRAAAGGSITESRA